MELEKILVGDDQIEFARANFPFIPDAETEFVSTPEEVIEKGKTGKYSLIVTDLNYTPYGNEGITVLRALKDSPARKILWTGQAYAPEVRAIGEGLGAEVLNKDELGTLVGQVVSKAPLKKDGKVLVYVAEEQLVGAIRQTVCALLGNENVTVSSKLRKELETGEYGLVIDTSTMQGDRRAHGTVAHDLKYVRLTEVPRVETVHNITTVVRDIIMKAEYYLRSMSKD
ncbi:hypothetical protein KY338_01660 [Candidatus Woesearchaeota archaeon]|nr:hypothetical protein [Candidatus Woesearchaeota archaeon]MBW3005619.1 hypothetical protein [Candidatus Woesearchaeota archaeon]